MPPTLLQKGKIKILPHMSEYEINKINNMAAKDYITDWFNKRIPSRRGGIPIIKPTSVNDRIMILRSGTGSGKSTTLGPELFIKFYDSTKRNIAVTQPRVLTAIQIPEEIANIYTEMTIGDNIGYQTGDYEYKPRKGVVFMTIGVLAQQLKVMSDEDFMNKYAFIVIDECHDRSLGMDLALSLSKKFIHRNYKLVDCPFLILTSATFDVEKYSNYYGVDTKNIIDVSGINYPIETFFPKDNIDDYIKQSADTALNIHSNNTDDYKSSKFTDILIFVYGTKPMKDIGKILEEANNKIENNNHFVLITLTGATFKKDNVEFRNIFKPLGSIEVLLKNSEIVTPKRRIIISTNVAETGVTIDTLKYLIDTGFENSAIFNPIYGYFSVLPVGVTKASALQRKGRVGRRAPGVYYPMYTELTFNNMQDDKYPELISSDLSDTILGLIVKTVYPNWDGVISDKLEKEGVFKIDEIDLLDYPAVDSINYSLEKLFSLGLIDSYYNPTTLGLITTTITKIPIEIIRMILAGYSYRANIIDLITIGAFMVSSKRDYLDLKSGRKQYTEDEAIDDFMEPVFILKDFMDQTNGIENSSIKNVKDWCKNNGISFNGIMSILSVRDSIIETFIQNIGMDPFYNGLEIPRNKYDIRQMLKENKDFAIDEIIKIKKCIYEGFRLNLCVWNSEYNSYIINKTNKKINVTSIKVKDSPKEIIVKSIDLRINRVSGVYEYESDTVSILDNYVNIDTNFIIS